MKNYYEILEGKRKPKFITHKDSLEKALSDAKGIMHSCEFCERKCMVDRLEGEKGFCGVGKEWSIFGAHTHLGEEPDLVPSATLFLAGCPLRCCYCQNAPESIMPNMGDIWKDTEVVHWINAKYAEGCKNVNFVTPDCYVWNILKVLSDVKSPIPVVWNSSSYYSEKTALLIKDSVDVYLLDFRYFQNSCAERLSQAPNYADVAKRNLLLANKYGDVLIRVLILPNHIICCTKPILKWIKDKLGSNTRVNIMEQYHPVWKAVREIDRRLTPKEYHECVEYAQKIGLKNLV